MKCTKLENLQYLQTNNKKQILSKAKIVMLVGSQNLVLHKHFIIKAMDKRKFPSLD